MVPRPQQHTFSRKSWWLDLLPKAAGPKNHYCPENVCFVGLGTPSLKQNTWQKQNFGIHLIATATALLHDKSKTEPRSVDPGNSRLCLFNSYLPRRDPGVFCWPSGVLEAWGTKAKKQHMFRKLMVCWRCSRRRQCQKTIMFLKCVVAGLGTPSLKKSLGKNTTTGSL